MKSLVKIEDHTDHLIRMTTIIDRDQDHRKRAHIEKEIGTTQRTEEVGIIVMQVGQITTIIII